MFVFCFSKISAVLIVCHFLISRINAKVILKETNVIRDDSDEKNPFTMEEFLEGTFSPSGWNGSWLTGNVFLYKTSDGDFFKYNVKTRTANLFIDGSFLDNYTGASVSLSPDQTYVLIKYNVSSVFRHSSTVICAIYDILSEGYYDINNQKPVQLVQFDTKGHGIVYVFENNIYYVEDIRQVSNPLKVTDSGVAGIIYNGVPDWVYEEEVLGSGSALWFSPDGNHIAYAEFNDTEVKEFSYFMYGNPGDMSDQYPNLVKIRYPKVGTPNPVVNLYVFDIQAKTTGKFNLPSSIQNTANNNDFILYDLTWISNSEIAMISTNRIQNHSIITRCNLNGHCAEEISYKQTGGWLSPKLPLYNVDGTVRIEILPQPYGDDYFDHIVITEVTTSNQRQLTYGKRVVTTIYGWDKDNNLIYYGGSINDTPSQQHVYVVNTETGVDYCLTCTFVVDEEYCKYASAEFSTTFTYYTIMCTGPNPTYVLIQNLKENDDSIIWNANEGIRNKLKKKLRFSQKDLLVPVSQDFKARVRLLLPPNFDEREVYPAVVYVYAGPNSNQINDAFSSRIQNYWVTNKRYIYILIDGRGSGRDGQRKLFQIYRKMGTIEIEDQITVTKYLQDNYQFIDRNNTGIWGWSYGGFASTWALVKDNEHVFKFALSVAPVTSFIYYDTIYTERYMGLPTEEDNLLGYNNTDITRNIEALRGRLYFVIHGNADDNVHYQQTMLLVKALETADISFRQQSYPDENHSLGHVSRHLYHTMDNFFARAFGAEEPSVRIWSK